MRRKFFFLPALIALAFAVAFAQQPSASGPSADRLRQVITYLASDALEGRRTGTPGANEAANYIAGEFSRLGLRPGMQVTGPARTPVGNQSAYLQPFPYVSSVLLGKANFLTIRSTPDSTINYRVNEEWMPLGFSTNGSINNAEIVFAGYGISSAELKYDDYAVSNAKDRIAIVFAGSPDGDNPHGQFVQAGQIRFKVAAARAAGARALVIIANEEKLNDDRLSRLSYDNAGEAGIPVIVISRQFAATILNSVQRLSEFEKAADSRNASDEKLRRPMSGMPWTLSVDVVRRESPSFNVVGILRGSDPALSEEAIVIGAHTIIWAVVAKAVWRRVKARFITARTITLPVLPA